MSFVWRDVNKSSNTGLLGYTYCKRQPPRSKLFRKVRFLCVEAPPSMLRTNCKVIYKEAFVFAHLLVCMSTYAPSFNFEGGCYEEHP